MLLVISTSYHMSTAKMNFDSAVKYCQDMKMELVKIPNAEANVC